MNQTVASLLSIVLMSGICLSQDPPKPQQQIESEDVIRITTNLVQTDAVITDKNDQIIKDLKLEDFELYDNGKRQDIKFLEFVGSDSSKRVEGEGPKLASGAKLDLPSNGVSAA